MACDVVLDCPMPTEMAMPTKATDMHAAEIIRRGRRPTRSMMVMDVHVADMKHTELIVAMIRDVSSGSPTDFCKTRGR
jgi:hypothetical protein